MGVRVLSSLAKCWAPTAAGLSSPCRTGLHGEKLEALRAGSTGEASTESKPALRRESGLEQAQASPLTGTGMKRTTGNLLKCVEKNRERVQS